MKRLPAFHGLQIQGRKTIRETSARARAGDAQAAAALFAHSIAVGHRRLSVQRYFLAKALGARIPSALLAICQAHAAAFSPEELRRAADEAIKVARRSGRCSGTQNAPGLNSCRDAKI